MAAISPSRRPLEGDVTLRAGGFSARVNVRVLLLAALVALLALALAAWAMTLGSFPLTVSEVIAALRGEGDPRQDLVVRGLRLPRVLAALAVGAALAVSGLIFQGLVRNPLVSPDVIGIESGATVAGVFWIVSGFDPALLPLAAFVGAIAAATAIATLAWKGGIGAERLVLVGIGIAAIGSAGTTFLLVRSMLEEALPAQVWLMGSLSGSNDVDVRRMGLGLLILIPVALVMAVPLRTLQLGDEVARGLGVPLESTRLMLILIGCALSATAVAVAGPIGFVALIAPQLARGIGGPPSPSLVVLTAAVGSLMLLGSDIVAQHMLPVSLPVGVVTAIVGAPWLLWLLYRANVRL